MVGRRRPGRHDRTGDSRSGRRAAALLRARHRRAPLRSAPRTRTRAGARALVGADDLIALVRGTVTWPELIASGRFELSGDPFLALRFASLFRLPVRLDPA